ncbi:MAG TPA: hypothetical protein VNY51_11105 [Candidatus Dormibacteraeota bacterium]|jgi:hypothetical protein|nr:hypothetical protein [Candidatus Dormibacteraeota bacterium]
MADINVLIVVDGIFSLTTTYPINPTAPPFGPESNPNFGPDAWFTLSHLINTLRSSTSPTFNIDTASRGFNAAGTFAAGITNSTPDPYATIKGPNPSTPTPFHFDDPGLDLTIYDEIWLFSDEGYDGPNNPVGPPLGGTGEPGGLTDNELTAITNFMEQGGGVFATGDHDGLGSAVGGRIPRVRYMRKWYSTSDTSPGIPPLAVTNWPGSGKSRVDTLQKGATDVGTAFFFDDQSDDIPQPLTVLVPSHPVIQGATGVLTVYPDHMHEGEVIVPTGAQLTQTSASDATLSFAGSGFTEFPAIDGYQEVPVVLAQSGFDLISHTTQVPPGTNPEDIACENLNFGGDPNPCNVTTNNTLAAYDGHTVNVGRIVTDSSFHHFLDLNLLGDPCSKIPTKQQGFNASASGKAHLKELKAFYINMATWLAWNDRKIYFVFGKNNYGRDEVADNFSWPDAFYLFLEGFTPNVVGTSPNITFSGSFNKTNIPGLSLSGPTITYDIGNTGANANVTQRIRFAYEINFTAASLASPTAFPAAGAGPNAYTIDAAISITGQPTLSSPNAEIFLLAGDDPYFTNINAAPGVDPQYYLSQDLRVFTITPTMHSQTLLGEPFTFMSGSPTVLDPRAAYAYIQKLITSLNKKYGYLNTGYTPPNTNVSDPLDSFLPQQNGALEGDSLVNPKTGSNFNYSFAIARVRLKGNAGTTSNTKVFFRVLTTQTFDTDFINSPTATTLADPNATYFSNGPLLNPTSPLPGTDGSGTVNGCSLPFFATANFNDGPTDYNGLNSANYLPISIPSGHDYAWAFFGCFLNVNDASNTFGSPAKPVQQWFVGANHSCLVAQIACADAPIENAHGVIESPENSDKLAQRNLQVTTSGNPGYPATHRVPQTIDVRPSPPPQSSERYSILSYPDEMMIDWGKTPVGSVVNIYWPGVSAPAVLQLAKQLYPAQTLTAADPNTIQCRVVSPVTYIPIPPGAGGSFAGLFTVELPSTVRYGNEFDILVRRITTKQLVQTTLPNNPPPPQVADAVKEDRLLWRYITGSFLARISVEQENKILPTDENLLAIMKWRLGLIDPSNRWYLVLLRYISYLSDRINGMGGNASQIPASTNGYQPCLLLPKHAEERCYTGKVIGIRYDRFGDFEGFTILSEKGHENWFRGREHEVEELVRQAWIERTLISVFVESHNPDWPASIVLRRHK